MYRNAQISVRIEILPLADEFQSLVVSVLNLDLR